MALQIDIEFSDGIEIPNAYVKIIKLTFNYIEPITVEAVVNIYKDFQAYTDKKHEVRQMVFTCTEYDTFFSNDKLESLNPQTCAYDWLKTFAMFSNALSV